MSKCNLQLPPNTQALQSVKGKIQKALNRVESDIAINNTRADNIIGRASFSNSIKNAVASNQNNQQLLGENGEPIKPQTVEYEVDADNLYGDNWGNIRPPGLHPEARYTSKKGESLKLLDIEFAKYIDIQPESDRNAFYAFLRNIQLKESSEKMAQASAWVGEGFDIRPKENQQYTESANVNADAGPFPRKTTSKFLKGLTIDSPFRPDNKAYRSDFGCWQYLPETWKYLIKKYEPGLLAANPQYKWCWLAPASLEMSLQLRELQNVWKSIAPNTPYVIRATMLYMYNFLPVTFNKLNDLITAAGPDNGWIAYLRFAEQKIIDNNEQSISFNPLNGLAYLKSISSSYKKMKTNVEIAKLETYSVPEDPTVLWNKYGSKG